MLVRYFWKNCDLYGLCHGDALWVEATASEAESQIFPHLPEETISESRILSEKTGHLAARFSRPDLTFCFVVSKDLSFIRPFHVHYPFHQLWNAYSPFRNMPDINVKTLDELSEIHIPQEY